MNKELKHLVTKANAASDRTRFGCYPMAPSVGLSEKEIRLHAKAIEAHGAAEKALKEAGLVEEAREHRKAIENHSWVTSRRGSF